MEDRRAAGAAAEAGPSSVASTAGTGDKPTVILVIGIDTRNYTFAVIGQALVARPSLPLPMLQPVSKRLMMAGMAGSGKTTLLQRIAAELQLRGKPGYVLNLDPAVIEVPYGANIDIRDTVRHAAQPHALGIARQ